MDLLNVTHDAVILWNIENGKIVSWNRSAERIYGWKENEVLGRAFDGVLGIHLPEEREAIYEDLFREGQWEGELVHIRRDGTRVTVASRWVLERDEQGNPIGVLQSGNDISALKRAEQERMGLVEQIRQAQNVRTAARLTSSVAHDFDNIFAAIIGFSELALDKTPAGTARNRMEHVLQAGIRGRELVKRILAYSYTGDEERGPLRLSTMVLQALGLIRALCPSTIDVEYKVSCDADYIHADATQIQQILMSLSTKALQTMRDKGGGLLIRLDDFICTDGADARHSHMEHGAYVRMSVSYTCCGTEKEVPDPMADRSASGKELYEGDEMDFTAVKNIMKGLGYATVEGQSGGGFVVHLFFPKLSGRGGR